ncbi:MAG: hypothetical protein ABIO39_13940 [Caulobacteraceae bacterium]
MALSPISAGLPATTLRPTTPVRSEAAIAAQRAFFQAALSQTQAVAPVTAAPTPPRPVTRVAHSTPTTDEPPERILRPGSLLDIRV